MTSASDTLTLRRYKRRNQAYREHLPDGVELIMMRIPAGEFMMGAPEGEPDSHDDERPQHRVQVAEFCMGQTPVTQAQWQAVVETSEPINHELKPDPAKFKGDRRPVERVSWEDAQEFCQRLSKLSKKDYRLPSEAEWEYACRADTETAYHFGPMLTKEVANYGRSVGETTDVRTYPANRWGLYDMHGNVDEWCEDDWHENYEGAPEDGSARTSKDKDKLSKLLRGGSWIDGRRYCRSAFRGYSSRDSRNDFFGFRVCCVLPSILLSS
ncbi:formylglycine-generating enzyme family protein [Leptolyngbya sp. CCY15150]|uniref:formylglycine-generating enzyme family protein n=1 Tax=Leptolyngbya sp. CCY15150 TaxID=2767772 RepID=UPI0031BA1076